MSIHPAFCPEFENLLIFICDNLKDLPFERFFLQYNIYGLIGVFVE